MHAKKGAGGGLLIMIGVEPAKKKSAKKKPAKRMRKK
jgi:hypothetical protein